MKQTPLVLQKRFRKLSTPLIADACIRLGLPLRVTPGVLRPVNNLTKLCGGVLPATHHGSVDVFLEAMEESTRGDILVIDNGGRMDEGCIGDLIALEALKAGLGGIIVWGAHRDTTDLLHIRLPVFSLGSFPCGPTRGDVPDTGSPDTLTVHGFPVTSEDNVFADRDGVIFVKREDTGEVLHVAESIHKKERRQASLLRKGKTLRHQLKFGEYQKKKASQPNYTFRTHLREIGGAIEE